MGIRKVQVVSGFGMVLFFTFVHGTNPAVAGAVQSDKVKLYMSFGCLIMLLSFAVKPMTDNLQAGPAGRYKILSCD